MITITRPPVVEGPYTSFYANGHIKSKGIYQNNLPDGVWEYYYESGNLKMIGELKQNVRAGFWKYYYENGNTQMEGTLKEGGRHGYWKFYYESGHLKSEGDLIDDQKEGDWKYYYEDGTLKAEASYTKEKGYYREFSSTGGLKLEGWITTGQSDSVWKYYHDNGKLKAWGPEKNGSKQGHWQFYDEDGKLLSEGEYQYDQPTGYWRYYYKNGNLNTEGSFLKGVKEGEWRSFYLSGRLKSKTTFANAQGLYEEYYENGRLQAKGLIHNGQYEGLWRYYYEEDGLLMGECTFTKGQGMYTGYYRDGKVQMEGKLENDKKVGVWTLYKPNGTLAGHYHPLYEDNFPRTTPTDSVFKQDNLSRGLNFPYVKPPLRLPRRKSRFFLPRHNEFKGFIVSNNLGALFLGSFPVSVEYYLQERLGFELKYTHYRDPFFKSSSQIGQDKVYNRGFSIDFRQKLYQPDDDLGMYYFGHEIRFTDMDYRARVVDPVDQRTIQADATLYEYSVLIGDRWMAFPGKRGFTVDGFLGLGIGYRHYRKGWNNRPDWDAIFDDVPKNRISIPVRVGLNIGYVF